GAHDQGEQPDRGGGELRGDSAPPLRARGLLHGAVPVPQTDAQEGGRGWEMIDVRMFTVGPVQENCFFVREQGSDNALVVDPGDEPDRLTDALEALGIST